MHEQEESLWDRADAILDRLLDLPRSRWYEELAAMRLAPDLDDCVRRLLDGHTRSGTLDHPPPHELNQAAHLRGRRIGDWILDRELGHGGMSVVWLAQRGDGPQTQRAALKLLTIGALSRSGIERFRREHAILARLNHPHVAHLHEAGVAEDGTPWLAMELVEGVRIDRWCDERALSVRQRIALVLDVCAAVDYAHRNLVVHADLKPSNVLVDGEGHVRILDFGIGRLLDEQREERTGTLWRAATPEYAAPEQIAGEPATTATDVFGLGALCYRLLTGRAPRQAGSGGTVGGPIPVDADLKSVLLKALEDEPQRRYASIEALRADLEAWLNGRPVGARRGNRGYRARKFILRHRLAVFAAASCVLLLVGGIAATAWQARRAELQAQRARTQAHRAEAVKDFLLNLLRRSDPGVVAGDPTASELLRSGANDLRSTLLDQPEVRVELLRAIGISQRARGLTEDARQSLDAALKLYESGAVRDPAGYADTLSRRAWVAYEQSRMDQAIAMLRRADAILQSTAEQSDRGLREHVRAGLADLLANAGHTGEATRLAGGLVVQMESQERTRARDYSYSLRILGTAADVEGRDEEAIAWFKRAEAAMDPVVDAPRLANLHNEMGLAYLHSHAPAEAERSFRAAVEGFAHSYGFDSPRVLVVRAHLADTHLMQGKPEIARDELREILRQERARHGDEPDRDIALDLRSLALANYRLGDPQRALQSAEQAWQMAQRLPAGFRQRRNDIAPLLGLLRMENRAGNADPLLSAGFDECATPASAQAPRSWICLARALHASGTSRCVLPPGPTQGGDPDRIERRWRAVRWLLRVRCEGASLRAEASRAIRALDGPDRPFPDWLEALLRREQLRTES